MPVSPHDKIRQPGDFGLVVWYIFSERQAYFPLAWWFARVIQEQPMLGLYCIEQSSIQLLPLGLFFLLHGCLAPLGVSFAWVKAGMSGGHDGGCDKSGVKLCQRAVVFTLVTELVTA